MQKLVRCSNCNKLLAKGIFEELEIKCPRCKRIQRARSSITNGAKDVQTPGTLDRWQAQTGQAPDPAIP
ncbi:Com family DNA-binding transcriptional regulator [Marinobacterium sedimentorum]|uniref:Com family DNA-binding transcriptional regulator n=1 Tax=Marinobacterium sedimentorum TaxID=2927804 RepID=UPI0020C66534|nr:Com family DNA-binding transcriptional regulator [Marinobacterium sedimentorum]MCP8687755.1 Com family DNA-binding transcriptional regulator [Marinobacterium sedimentorum]